MPGVGPSRPAPGLQYNAVMTHDELPVLLVDDEVPVVRALEVLLDLHDIPHLSATSAEGALDLARRHTLGAAVQDMNFGKSETSGEEGIALFHAIREVQAGLPILLMTAWASLETAVQLVKEGAADYIEKPWEDNKLVAAIQNLVAIRDLQLENQRLRGQIHRSREALAAAHDLRGIVYVSEEMHQVLELAVAVARSDAPVLLVGPSGCGKERIAEVVQANSPRRRGPFVRVNVGALPEELMESELFGAEPGAYTGLKSLRIGRFESATGGTLFLDEIDALSLSGQVKLLRVLQSGEFQRLGSSVTRRADVRILSATNSDLNDAIRDKHFRQDLYFRLNVVELAIPALRDRTDDILPLARHFLERFTAERAPVPALGEDAMRALEAYSWPGNVRELENRIQRAMLVATGEALSAANLDLGVAGTLFASGSASGSGSGAGAGTGTRRAGRAASGPAAGSQASDDPADSGDATEREHLVAALQQADGVVARAAEELGISRQALYRRMQRLGVQIERRTRG
jgi:DNA-binding NtrC family response regulator